MFEDHRHLIESMQTVRVTGRLSALEGLLMRACHLPAELGSMCTIQTRLGDIRAQVVGFDRQYTLLMPLQDAHGAAKGDAVFTEPSLQQVAVGPALLGRVIDGLGQSVDGGQPIHPAAYYPVFCQPPHALQRSRILTPLGTGIRVLDATMTVGSGQRIGIFAGTGVGKSVLLGMVSRYTEADVTVVALVGERGREVKDFIEKDLGPDGLQRTVMVVSTSDESPVMRVRACFVATAVAEYFRDQGKRVLLLMDSLTRLAMAQRQIGLAVGEPPATKGYTPSVFTLLPKLLERAGHTADGSITGFYSVLVEGDDINEPISDAVRGILDGHVSLSRQLAGRGHYPAVDVLNSISRLMIDVVDDEHYQSAQQVRQLLGVWSEIEDLVNIGAYASGTNPLYDLCIQMKPRIDEFARQAIEEQADLDHTRQQLLTLAAEISTAEQQLKAASSAA